MVFEIDMKNAFNVLAVSHSSEIKKVKCIFDQVQYYISFNELKSFCVTSNEIIFDKKLNKEKMSENDFGFCSTVKICIDDILLIYIEL